MSITVIILFYNVCVPFMKLLLYLNIGGGVVTLPLKPKNYVTPTSHSAAAGGNKGGGTDISGMFAKFADNIKSGLKEIGGAVNNVVLDDVRISGTISFKINFSFPVWEQSVPRNPASFHRRVSVSSGKNLPEVNGSLPSCKVVIMYGGVIIGKSMVIPTSSFPIWPETVCDLVVSFDSATPVVIQVCFLLFVWYCQGFLLCVQPYINTCDTLDISCGPGQSPRHLSWGNDNLS